MTSDSNNPLVTSQIVTHFSPAAANDEDSDWMTHDGPKVRLLFDCSYL